MPRHKVFLFVGIILVVIFVPTTPILLETWKQKALFEGSLQEYCIALEKGDFRTAYSLTDQAFQHEVRFDEFVKTHQSLESKLGKLVRAAKKSPDIHGTGGRWGRGMDWIGVALVTLQFEK